jgi:hypothetical protein
MSALSYLGDKFVPIEVVLAALPATSSTCFVSTVGLKVGGEAETSCLDAGDACGMVNVHRPVGNPKRKV